MRVAIHHPDPERDPAAFRLGRIDDHVDVLTGETTPKDKVAEILAKQAQEEFPDCTIKIEYLHDNGDGTSTWKEDKPGEAEAAPVGETRDAELSTVAQAAAGTTASNGGQS